MLVLWRNLHIDPIEKRMVDNIYNRIFAATIVNFFKPSPTYLYLTKG